MASWKKVAVSGSNISQFVNDLGYVASTGGGIISASAEGDAQGQIKLNGVNVDINALGATDSPSFTTVTADLTGDVTGDLTGTASIATKLTDARNFSIGGEVTASNVSFDGTGNVTLSATLGQNVVDTAQILDGAVDGDKIAQGSVGSVQLADIGIISASAEGDAQGQIKLNGVNINANALGTDDSPTFTNLTLSGNLTVQGDTVTLNTANVQVEDQFILLNSGSNSGDVGIVFAGAGGSSTVSGSAIFYDDSDSVFSFAEAVGATDTVATQHSKLGAIIEDSDTPNGAPGMQGLGTIYIHTGDESIWVYS